MAKKKPKYLNKAKKTSLHKGLIALFLILSFVFRIIHLESIKENDPTFYNLPYGTDMVTYDTQAQDIIKGKHPTPYYYGPLYSYFLAIIYVIFGHNLYIARLIQMILGVFTLFFIFRIGDLVFGRKVAIIALILGTCYDMFILHEGLLLLEALNCFLNTLSLYFLLKIEKEPNLRFFILGGLSLGLASLTRANILLFLPFIFLWMIIVFKKKAIYKFILLSLFTFIFISPATIMNYIKTGKFILISTNGPINLWIGNNEMADGRYLQPETPKHLEKRLKEIGDKAYIEEVIKFIKEKPDVFIRLLLRKFFLFWEAFEEGNNMNYYQIKREYSPFLNLPFFIGFGTIAPLALFGIILALRKKHALLLNLYVLSSIIALIAFCIIARYRIAIVPVFIVFASFAICFLYERIKGLEYKRLLSYLPILIFSFILVWHKEIYATFVPFIYPSGIHREENNATIIKDTSDEWRGGNAILLTDGDMVKKELIIEEDLSLYKEAEIAFKYAADASEGILTINVNDSYSIPLKLGISTQGLVKGFSFPIPISSLKNGKNSFVFSVVGKALFFILYDETYSFGRSYKFNKNIKKGEFLVWLTLKK